MLRKMSTILGLGVVWLFIFSIPVDRDRKIFDVGYHTIVNTKPMHWLVNRIRGYVDETREKGESALGDAQERFSRASQSRDLRP